ncbi:MAG: hypothetical protein R2755_02840 [Acidimicrobiales bacterium]
MAIELLELVPLRDELEALPRDLKAAQTEINRLQGRLGPAAPYGHVSGGSPSSATMIGAAVDDYSYPTTIARHSGRSPRNELCYAAHGEASYLLADGGRSTDWVPNLLAGFRDDGRPAGVVDGEPGGGAHWVA